MMVDSKRKGSDFERKITKKLNKLLNRGEFKRIAGSGAFGTTMKLPMLTGDIMGEIKGFQQKFKVECKVGYGGSTQMTLKKEWLDKIEEEAKSFYSIPFLVGRFSGSRSGVEEFVVMDLNEFVKILNLVTELYEEVENGLE